jgi:hypothetical protein
VALYDCPEKTASTTYVSEQINRRRLYVQRDGGEVFPAQMFLRARKYPQLFTVINRDTVWALPAPRRKLKTRR